MSSNVFNGKIGSTNIFGHPQLSEQEEQSLLAELFEQFMLFDKITIRTDRLNFPLILLIKHLGINLVEELIERQQIIFLLWTPVILTGGGRQLDSGEIDESVVIGQPPIATGQLSDEDKDPENNIERGLSHFGLHRDRRRIFTRKALKNYIIPQGMEFSQKSAEFIVDAYKANNLKSLGLPFNCEPENLNINQRRELLNLGNKILETSVLSKYELKSSENYEHIKICQTNLENIGKAYKISQNTSELLKLENIPDLKTLFLTEKFDFQTAMKLRNLSNAKYFRKWINSVGESENVHELTTEYLSEIKGKTKYFDSGEGKFLRTSVMFAIGAALGVAVTGPSGALAGFALSQLDTFWLDKLLKGKTPSMFIEDIKYEREEKIASK